MNGGTIKREKSAAEKLDYLRLDVVYIEARIYQDINGFDDL
jgi:hypothetical protein